MVYVFVLYFIGKKIPRSSGARLLFYICARFSKDTLGIVNVRYRVLYIGLYIQLASHLYTKACRKTTFYTKNLGFVIALRFWVDVVKATIRTTEKYFLEADWLKTTDVISSVPVLPCRPICKSHHHVQLVVGLFFQRLLMCVCCLRLIHSVIQSQKAVTIYFTKSRQLLPFGFADQYCLFRESFY